MYIYKIRNTSIFWKKNNDSYLNCNIRDEIYSTKINYEYNTH